MKKVSLPLVWLSILVPVVAMAQPAPQRLAVLSPHSVEMVYAVGAGERIIATVEYADFPESAKLIPRVGSYNAINLEALLAFEPDLVLLSYQDTNALILKQIKGLGLPVEDTSVSQIDGVATRLRELGQRLGVAEKASQAADDFEAKLAKVRQQYQGRAEVKVFYQIWPAPLTTVSDGWMSQVIADCGGINVFNDNPASYPQVSQEQVILTMPEVILKPHYHGAAKEAGLDWNRWPEIPAVKRNQQHFINGDLVHRTGPRLVDGMKEVCEAIDAARQAKAH